MRVLHDVMEKRRKVKYATYSKWLVQYDREYHTKTWLDCETPKQCSC